MTEKLVNEKYFHDWLLDNLEKLDFNFDELVKEKCNELWDMVFLKNGDLVTVEIEKI